MLFKVKQYKMKFYYISKCQKVFEFAYCVDWHIIFFHMEGKIRDFTCDKNSKVLILIEEGWNYWRNAQRFHVAHTTVSRGIQRYKEDGNHVENNEIATLIWDQLFNKILYLSEVYQFNRETLHRSLVRAIWVPKMTS